MSELQTSSSSSNLGYALTFAAGAAAGAGALYYLKRRKLESTISTKGSIANGSACELTIPHSNVTTSHGSVAATGDGTHQVSIRNFEQDHILSEHLTRNVQFFGLEGQKQISNAFVVVVGLGVRFLLASLTFICWSLIVHPTTSH